MKKTQKKLGNKGFSLVELIVVIAIMAVLVGVLAPTLIKNIEKSRESKDAQNCEQLKSSAEVALQNEEVYAANVPTTSENETVLLTITSSGTIIGGDPGKKFENELKTSIDPTKTKLTSKKYTGVSGKITVTVNTNGQVSINGVPES